MNTQISPSDLNQFTGTENYFKTQIPNLWYTDGCQFLFQQAQCYWLLDEIQYAIMSDKKVKPEEFILIEVKVKDNTAGIFVTDGNLRSLFRKHIEYTDMPSGDWKMYVEIAECGGVIGKLIMIPSER